MNIGTVIKQLREEKGLKQLALGFAVGNDSAYISKVENGKIVPSLEMIIRIAEALEVEPLEIFERLFRK